MFVFVLVLLLTLSLAGHDAESCRLRRRLVYLHLWFYAFSTWSVSVVVSRSLGLLL
jgi:hypothetical protein